MDTKSKTNAPPTQRVLDELQDAKDYWLETVYQHIKGRLLVGGEWLVARHANSVMREAQRAAIEKLANIAKTQPELEGNVDAFKPEIEWMNTKEFAEPKELIANTSLNPDAIALTASGLLQKSNSIDEAVQLSVSLHVKAHNFLKSLPHKETVSLIDLLQREHETRVSFKEIIESNNLPGRIPLLPRLKKGEKEPEDPYEYLRVAIRGYFQSKIEGSQRDEMEWVKEQNQCLDSNTIRVSQLCELRWSRFKKEKTQQRERRASPRPKKV